MSINNKINTLAKIIIFIFMVAMTVFFIMAFVNNNGYCGLVATTRRSLFQPCKQNQAICNPIYADECGGLVVSDCDSMKVHAGEMFNWQHSFSLNSSQEKIFLIKNISGASCYLKKISSIATKKITSKLYKSPTVTSDGTQVDIHGKNYSWGVQDITGINVTHTPTVISNGILFESKAYNGGAEQGLVEHSDEIEIPTGYSGLVRIKAFEDNTNVIISFRIAI